MSQTEIPVSATARVGREDRPAAARPRVLITGAAGVLGTILARAMSPDHSLIGVDLTPVQEPEHWAEVHELSGGERQPMVKLVADADVVLHLAHGAYAGWEGLREVDIDGTRNVLDGAVAGRCRRVVLASSNHVVGWSEVDMLAGAAVDLPVNPGDPPRPDGLYGAAKTAMRQVPDLQARHRRGFALDVVVDARHDLEQRLLARAVEPEHADLGAREEAERNVLEDLRLGGTILPTRFIVKTYCAMSWSESEVNGPPPSGGPDVRRSERQTPPERRCL